MGRSRFSVILLEGGWRNSLASRRYSSSEVNVKCAIRAKLGRSINRSHTKENKKEKKKKKKKKKNQNKGQCPPIKAAIESPPQTEATKKKKKKKKKVLCFDITA